nr:MAG TPA: hypothetical protein [Caudoviricetes sp.]
MAQDRAETITRRVQRCNITQYNCTILPCVLQVYRIKTQGIFAPFFKNKRSVIK